MDESYMTKAKFYVKCKVFLMQFFYLRAMNTIIGELIFSMMPYDK